ncbi:DUF2269 family protein [Lysinibacillus odysseyi]
MKKNREEKGKNMMVYKMIIFIHVVSAVAAIGPLFSIFPILKRMEKAEERDIKGMVEGLRGVVRAVSLGGHVLIISGIALIWLSGWSWKTPWVLATIILLIASLFFLAKAFKPAWRIAEADYFHKETFIAVMKRAAILYITIMLMMLWLMVVKPQLW